MRTGAGRGPSCGAVQRKPANSRATATGDLERDFPMERQGGKAPTEALLGLVGHCVALTRLSRSMSPLLDAQVALQLLST